MLTESTEVEKAILERTGERRIENSGPPNGQERRVATADRRYENNLLYATFRLGRHFLGVEVDKVQEVFTAREMTGVPLAPSAVTGLINLRGHIILTIDLRKRLGFPDREPEAEVMSIVVRTAEGPVNLLVDAIGDVIEVRPDLFEAPPTTLDKTLSETVEGVYKLKDHLLLTLSTEAITTIGS